MSYSKGRQPARPSPIVFSLALIAFCFLNASHGFSLLVPSSSSRPGGGSVQKLRPRGLPTSSSSSSPLLVSSVSEDKSAADPTASKTTEAVDEDSLARNTATTTTTTATTTSSSSSSSSSSFLSTVTAKIGTVDETRLLYPEYDSGQVPRMFSSLEYNQNAQGRTLSATHAAGSVLGAAALIAGTTVGAGVLALPTATAAAGFLPSSAGMIVAWVYMTMSGLLISELTLNRMASTGRPGLGLLELYENSLGKTWSSIGSAAYFFLHYAMMVAYIAKGGANLDMLFSASSVAGGLPDAVGPLVFAAVCGISLYAASPAVVEKVNNVLVLGVAAAFFGIIGIGAGSADFGALVDPANQHFDQVTGCFPILFLSLVYQNVVPTVVTQLEGDRTKITQAIVAGTSLPLLMFLAFNGIVLGNIMGTGGLPAEGGVDPLSMLQSGTNGALLGPLVSTFSSLALVTSVIGFTYGLVDAWTDFFQINPKSEEMERIKAPLFALVYGPPLALSLADPSIFYKALEYGGAFGVSTLFLVLPPLMVWKERYSEQESPLMTRPMVPFGKLALGSMWKAAGALIIEQGAEKLGVFDVLGQVASQWSQSG